MRRGARSCALQVRALPARFDSDTREVTPLGAAFDFITARKQVLASTIPGPLKLVLLTLIEYMPHCHAGLDRIARECTVGRRSIIRAIARLERMGVLRVERETGRANRYHLRPVEDWHPDGPPERGRTSATEDTGAVALAPVADIGTGANQSPVPTVAVTRANEGVSPVPTVAPTSAKALAPKAVLSGSSKHSEAGAARARVFTMPSEAPTKSYLDACVMAGVKPEQARGTWNHYWTQGLPPGGVEKLEPWLVKQAKERQDALARVPAKAPAAPPRPGDDLDTTGAAMAFKPSWEHRDFAARHLPGKDINALAFKCRQVKRFNDSPSRDAEFMARLRSYAETGVFLADGPLPRPKKPAQKETSP